MKEVVIIFRKIHQYRKDFYDLLKDSLLEDNVNLTLIYGKLDNAESKGKNDQVDVEWGKFIKNNVFSIGNKELIWQPCLKHLKGADIVIVEQANKLLINYYLMFARRWLHLKFCYWGHGRNRQMKEDSIYNKFKYLFIKNCDWWFAYTKEVKDFLTDMGFPKKKITIVQNAINTNVLREQYEQISQTEIEKVKYELNINTDFVGIYCGAMYAEKRIDFTLEVCYKIKKSIPEFNMIFIGSGEELYKVKEAANNHDWIYSLGSKFGEEKVKYFKIAAVQIMPGAVGLGILDSFAMETPLITTVQDFHGPEISYLENEKNGVITKNDIEDYTNAVVRLLISKEYIKMSSYCQLCAEKYTIEHMVENFKTGILYCLDDY